MSARNSSYRQQTSRRKPRHNERNRKPPNPRARKAQTSARRMSARLQGVSKEGVVILLLVACLFLLLAFFSYTPDDPSWSYSGPEQKVSNWMGPVGAWLSDVLYSLFGASALWWPGILGFGAWRLMRSKEAHLVWDPIALAVRGGGMLLVLVATCTIGAVHFYSPQSDLPYGAGGIIGEGISSGLGALIGVHGTTLVALGLLLCGMPLLTGMSWLAIVDEIGRGGLRGLLWLVVHLGGAGERFSEHRQQRREERRAERESIAEEEFDFGDDESEEQPVGERSADEVSSTPREGWWSRWRRRRRASQLEPAVPSSSSHASPVTDETGNGAAVTAISAREEDETTTIPWETPTQTPSAHQARMDSVAPRESADHGAPSDGEPAGTATSAHDEAPTPNATVDSTNTAAPDRERPPLADVTRRRIPEIIPEPIVPDDDEPLAVMPSARASSSTSLSASREAPAFGAHRDTSHDAGSETDVRNRPTPPLAARGEEDEPTSAISMRPAHDEHEPVASPRTDTRDDEPESTSVGEPFTAADGRRAMPHADYPRHEWVEPTWSPAAMREKTEDEEAEDDVLQYRQDSPAWQPTPEKEDTPRSEHPEQAQQAASARSATEATPPRWSTRQVGETSEQPDVPEDNADDSAVSEGPTLWTVEHLQNQRPETDEDAEPLGAMPSLSLLTPPDTHQPNYTPEQLEEMAELLEVRLREYGVKAEVVATWPGPVITRFEIKPAAGVKVSKISNLAKDLARSLLVKSVRVVEVIPGRPTVGIEIPNPHRAMIRLREVFDSDAYQQAESPVTVALGQDIGGNPVVANLNKMPHLLVAGTTGSGKSVGVNAMLISMLLKATPDEVRMIMVDPKMLELSVYDGIPHLLAPVVTDMKEAANALRWCVAEMERRYKLMAAMGVRNLAGFNAKLDEAERHGAQVADPLWEPQPWEMHQQPPVLEKLPYIVVVIDEFADMFMIVGKKVEELIARLAQKARAAGIHLILATQRPSVDVVTGLIKANIPTRMAFQVSSRVDSRTILDQGGAENLLGHGDMLYLPAGAGMPTRVHGAFVDDDEVHRVVEDWKRRGTPEYVEEILTGGVSADALTGLEAEGGDGGDAEQDALYDEAVAYVTESRRASISAVQRRFKIGYNRAARLVEAMEMAGVVSSMGSNGQREVIAPSPAGH